MGRTKVVSVPVAFDLCELILFEVGHKVALVPPKGQMRREVCDSKLLEELKEVSLLAELDLGCFMALVASITQLVTLSFLATARAELRE